jgi:CRP/FNR family transcriptional regulator
MNIEQKVELLKQSLLLSALQKEELLGLAKLAVERCFAPGEFVFWEGDPPEWFYFVERGKIKMLKHSSLGKEFLIAVFGPGEVFGEVAVFDSAPYPASAQAAEETCALGVRREDFLSFLSQNPPVSLKVINILGKRLREAHNRLRDLAGERVEQRLAGILLMLHSKLGPTLPFTRQEIADMSGTTTETAIRVMTRLRDSGIIRSSRGKITILDETKLRALSEGSPVTSSGSKVPLSPGDPWPL